MVYHPRVEYGSVVDLNQYDPNAIADSGDCDDFGCCCCDSSTPVVSDINKIETIVKHGVDSIKKSLFKLFSK
jgi:inorganic pyrophosphatase